MPLPVLCLAGLAPASASAQVAVRGSMVVIVEDESGQRLPGALVTADASDSLTRRESVSDARGEASLRRLDPSAGYVVTVALNGFRTARRSGVLVRSGQTTTIPMSLRVGEITEEITVTAETPLVDTTSAITGQDITLELAESLPTGRSYMSYLQLVPGVLPAAGDAIQEAPAARSGTNYNANGGTMGRSQDNFYYIDGVNVTDGSTGLPFATLNPEVIQEQQVLSGGLPAEFVGAPGLLCNVITKSGGDQLHGSVNYFFQDSSLVADDEHAPDQRFSTFDAAVTLGGPILRRELWFFTSYRRRERDADVTAGDTRQLLRTVSYDEDSLYARLTWAPTTSDTLSLSYFDDPGEFSGTDDPGRSNARDNSGTRGGSKYSAKYTKLLGPVVVDLAYGLHTFDADLRAVLREPMNQIIFRAGDARTLADEQLGGSGFDALQDRDTELYKAAFQWSAGQHHVKGGFELWRSRFADEFLQVGAAGYLSLAPHLAGTRAGAIAAGGFTGVGFDPFAASDYDGFIRSVDASADRAVFYAAFDADGDGVISAAELGEHLAFGSTAGNPHGAVNYVRQIQTSQGARSLQTRGLSFYLQDSVRLGRLTLNAGVRSERFDHFATTGERLFTFDWNLAPRVSVVLDVGGDGRQKLSAFYGRYYDPVRTNITFFAGSLSGTAIDFQVFALDRWVTFHTRGSAQRPEAVFAPTTRTPWTEDLQLGYAIDLGSSMSLEAMATRRRTRDILEDYDLSLYALRDDGTTNYPGPIDHPDSLFLGLDYFGFSSFPAAKFAIATAAGAERDYHGLELVFRKRRSNDWQGLLSYTFGSAHGNADSDSHVLFQGDLLWLDPRAPNRSGPMPGSIRHLLKAAASYEFGFGLELGGTYRWNSGTLATRRLGLDAPARVSGDDAFEFAGIEERWLAPGAVGALQNPAGGQLDIRLSYRARIGALRGELFLDAFNVLDDQSATRNEDRVAGRGTVAFGDPFEFRPPRRFYLGARLSF